MSFKQLQKRAELNNKQLGMLLHDCSYSVINGYLAGNAVPKSITERLEAFILSKT